MNRNRKFEKSCLRRCRSRNVSSAGGWDCCANGYRLMARGCAGGEDPHRARGAVRGEQDTAQSFVGLSGWRNDGADGPEVILPSGALSFHFSPQIKRKKEIPMHGFLSFFCFLLQSSYCTMTSALFVSCSYRVGDSSHSTLPLIIE